MTKSRAVHLLYVPTLHCNLGCRYCYLGSQTDTPQFMADNERAVLQLQKALRVFESEGVLPFNVSLHGGEVTTLSPDTLEGLFDTIENHYTRHKQELDALGFSKRDPHIKTNLYNFHHHYALLEAHKVSISASIDLPLSLHEKWRRGKNGHSTLGQTVDNLRLLSNYPHRKKFSSTLFRQHFDRIDELIADIWYVHRELGFDMTHYNFMFGFEAEYCDAKFEGDRPEALLPMSEAQMLAFYERMKQEFSGTELEDGFKRYWFEEFTPDFCTNSTNCGEKFLLLQSDGEVFSCVRGQGVPEFRYGNLFREPLSDILLRAQMSIKAVVNKSGLHADCASCAYLHWCQTGCPFVKKQMNNQGKSYTCLLQQAIYKDNPEKYPPLASAVAQREALFRYAHEMHPQRLFDLFEDEHPQQLVLPSDLNEGKNTLWSIIQSDAVLQVLYSSLMLAVEIDGQEFALQSPLLKPKRTIVFLSAQSKFVLKIRSALFEADCNELVRNSLYLQMLRNTPIVYGAEQRTKQAHTFTYQLFAPELKPLPNQPEWLGLDLMPLLIMHANTFRTGVLNNMLVSSSALRDYHYRMQRENGFYHIQALNLPFPNIEFLWTDD